jgi:peptide/nickel transport system permease protein
MAIYILKRLGSLIPLIFGISVLAFALLALCPGDPARIAVSALMENETPPVEAIEEMRREMGLDQPYYVQYALWMKKALRFDLGRSYQTGRTVMTELGQALPATAWLAGVTMVLTVLIMVPVGVVAAVNKGSLPDKVALLFSLGLVSMPDFFIGVMLILIFSLTLKLVPVAGYGGWDNIVLPSLALSLNLAAISARLMRTSMIQALDEKFIVAARAKGLREAIVVSKHALRNAAVPVLTYAGLQFGYLFGNTVVIESIFRWPGLGRLLVGAVLERDIFLVQGCVITIALIYVLINLFVDILYAIIDPRIRYDRM